MVRMIRGRRWEKRSLSPRRRFRTSVRSLIEVEGPGLSVAPELGLECDPDVTRSAPSLADDVLQLHGERPEDLGQDDAVHPEPGGRGGGAVGEDVVVKGVALGGEKDEVPPAGVGGGVGV